MSQVANEKTNIIPVEEDGRYPEGFEGYVGLSHGDIHDSDERRRMKVAHEYSYTDCGTRETLEWRKGPTSPRTLCYIYGLRWEMKKKRIGPSIQVATESADSRPQPASHIVQHQTSILSDVPADLHSEHSRRHRHRLPLNTMSSLCNESVLTSRSMRSKSWLCTPMTRSFRRCGDPRSTTAAPVRHQHKILYVSSY